MKSAMRKDFLREISHTRSRFLSILVLVALSVAFLSGLRATAPDMKHMGDHYLDGLNLADIQVLSNLGLTQDDLDVLLAQEGIERGEGAYVIDAFASSQSAELVAKVYSLTENDINNVELRSGRMPESTNECVVEEKLPEMLDIALGDTITLEPGDSMADALRYETFTVVGTIRSPVYISVERGAASIGTGTVKAYLYLPRGAFDLDYYTAIHLRAAGAAELTAFYDAYDDYIDDRIDALEPLADERAQHRHDELVDEANEKLDDAQRELDDAKADADETLGKAARELDDARQELADARQELDDGWAELSDAEQTLSRETANARREIADAKTELADALEMLSIHEAEYEDGLAQYEDGRSEYEDGLAQYEDGLARYEAGLAQYEGGLSQYEAGVAELTQTLRAYGLSGAEDTVDPAALAADPRLAANPQLAAAVAQLAETKAALDAAKAELDGTKAVLDATKARLDGAAAELSASKARLDEARAELDAGWAEYNDGLAQIDGAERTLSRSVARGNREIADARRELEDGEAKYADGLAEYEDGLAEYEDGKREADEKIADAEQELLDAQRKVAEIEKGEWYLFSRSYNPGYTGFGQDADRMANLASVFPMIFFLVAALVCLTTMTRMVEEQRIQIGSLKALGYNRLAISAKYLGYGLLPSLIGSALGLLIGYTLFPTMIFTAYQIMYQMPDIELHAYPDISAFSVLAAVACTTLSTLWACLATLRETPASLMRQRSPKAGKRVLLEYVKPLWQRMKFIHKVTARNLFRYQKRFWMTVIGIGGCTALIIAGFGLRSSLLFTMSRQFDELFHYTAQLALSDTVLPEERSRIEAFLDGDERIADVTRCVMSSATVVSGSYSTNAYVEVLEADELPVSIELYDHRTGETMTMGDGGVYIDQKLSELLGVSVGDTFFVDGDARGNVTVAGIFEHYTAHFVYMTPTYYETAFGAPAEPNAYLLTFTSNDAALCDDIFEELMGFGGVAATQRMQDTRDTYLHSMERIDFVVVIVILAAAALAVVVLYNLSNINITERMRELATIKLLGFYDGEVSAYVYRENIVLTILGIAAGILMGHWLHTWLVRSVEIDLMMFGRETDPMSYLYAAVLTALFSLLVNLIAHFRMKKIDMVESLKSAE